MFVLLFGFNRLVRHLEGEQGRDRVEGREGAGGRRGEGAGGWQGKGSGWRGGGVGEGSRERGRWEQQGQGEGGGGGGRRVKGRCG